MGMLTWYILPKLYVDGGMQGNLHNVVKWDQRVMPLLAAWAWWHAWAGSLLHLPLHQHVESM